MSDHRRPSFVFRLRQVFLLPWRLVCWRRGHKMYKWACLRCLRVDEVLLAAHHIDNILRRGRLMRRRDQGE